ncbi:MAG TPA: YncE family protein [Terriglobia bacterium]|nr:YncE family protein [Terriglobia bacterium]
MNPLRKTYLLLIFAFALTMYAQRKEFLKLAATTPLPGFSGDFDHFAVDLKGNRLFLTAEDHKTVEVFDLRTGKPIQSVTGFEEPHALVYLPDSNTLIVTDGNNGVGKVELVRGTDYKIVNSIELHPNVDGAVFNPINKYYYVESGGGRGAKTHLLHIIDTKTFKRAGDITLPGDHSEAMAIDRAGKKLYVNLTGTDEVGMVDLNTHQVTARWPVPDAHVENAIALDEPNHRLFTATRQPPRFFVFDTDTGKVVTTLPCTGVNDDMWFDTARKRIYVTGTDTTTVIEQRDADHYEHVAEVPTGFRARTSVFVPDLKRLYIAVSGKGKPDAQLSLQIYDVLP